MLAQRRRVLKARARECDLALVPLVTRGGLGAHLRQPLLALEESVDCSARLLQRATQVFAGAF